MGDITTAVIGERAVLILLGGPGAGFGIALTGRGRMPIRRVAGADYATIWDDVVLPSGTRPELRYTFIRSVKLSRLAFSLRFLTRTWPACTRLNAITLKV